jgi:hypothetical protein
MRSKKKVRRKDRKNREPMKSTWRDGVSSKNELNKHLERKRKKKKEKKTGNEK